MSGVRFSVFLVASALSSFWLGPGIGLALSCFASGLRYWSFSDSTASRFLPLVHFSTVLLRLTHCDGFMLSGNWSVLCALS